MPTNLEEIKCPSSSIYTNYSETEKAYLKKSLIGTVCFPSGMEFGCGDPGNLDKGKIYNLKTTLSPYAPDLSLETQLELKGDWPSISDRCQWCSPEICYPESTVSILECHSKIKFWRSGTIKTVFSGSRYNIKENCTQNDPRCNCDKSKLNEQTHRMEKQLQDFPNNNYAVVLIPVNFIRDENSNQPSSPIETADAAQKVLLDEPIYDVLGISEMTPTIGVINPSRNINWLNPTHKSSHRQLSLLSRNCMDFVSSGTSTFYLKNNFLPVLAVTQSLPNSIAEASITLNKSGKDIAKHENTVEVRTGLFTILWTEFNIDFILSDISKKEEGIKARLQIKLKDKNDGSIVGQLIENYTILY